MAGYSDTRQLIIDTLMGRPAGTEIQPEDHQAFALQITDYVRAVELVAGNATPIGFADASTVPVQPDNGQAVYLSQVNRGTTVTFANFIDQNGNAISVTSDSSSVTFVTLLWNGQYWSSQTTVVSASVLTAETMRVTFTQSGSTITSSDSAFAIKTAYNAGKFVYAVLGNQAMPLTNITSEEIAVFEASDYDKIVSYGVQGTAVMVAEFDINSKINSISIAPAWAASTTYAVGDLVTYLGALYKCTTAHTSGSTWDSTKWTTDKVSEELTPLKRIYSINELNAIDTSKSTTHLDFIKEFYMYGTYDSTKTYRISNIRRNVSGKYQVYIKNNDNVTVGYYESTTEETILSFSGIGTYYGYKYTLVVNWDSFEDGEETATPIYLTDNVYDIHNSPIITSIFNDETISETISTLNTQLYYLRVLGYKYLGTALPNSPTKPETRINGFYLASTPGTYQYLSNVVIREHECAAIICSAGETTWIKHPLYFAKTSDFCILSSPNTLIRNLYISSDILTDEQISSVTSATFYNSYHSTNSYISGLILRSSSTNVLDARIAFSTEEESLAYLEKGYFDLGKVKYNVITSLAKGSTESVYTEIKGEYVSFDSSKLLMIRNSEICAINSAFKKDETIIEPTPISGNYLIPAAGGTPIASSGKYCYTEPIELKSGETILAAMTVSSTVCAISIKSGSSYIAKLVGVDNFQSVYEYTNFEESSVNIVLSYNYSRNVFVTKYRKESYYEFSPSLNEVIGTYFMTSGLLIYSNSDSVFTSRPIRVYQGDIITYTASGTTSYGLMCTCNKDGNDSSPVIIPEDSSSHTYTYKVQKSGYVQVCGLVSATHSLSIKRECKYYDIDSISAEQDDNVTFYEDKHYYVDNSRYIPDNTSNPGLLFYDADDKVSTNHIVNAVAYPNGTIIACRDGGNVVKIDLDGTETTLLTISGATDWRGMFIDSNNNVYVSPHASVVGGSMQMTDRGLYRLAYGQSTFIKVISLYNPSSTVPTEAESNDDTFWNICEDKLGNLYAGVYAHSVHVNPAIYRSIDGGITWTYLYNFVTSGLIPADGNYGRAKHIHDIIANPYNNALYCIIGEVNTICKSVDYGVTWTDLQVRCEDSKGTTLIASPDGVLIGSDGANAGVISKLYSDDKTIRTVGKFWHAEFMAMRRSDLTGWLYAWTKIEPTILSTYPPVAAITDASALQTWKDAQTVSRLRYWTAYNTFTSKYYTDNNIRPICAAILVSKDGGDNWEIVYKTNVGDGGGNGFFCTGYFRDGECLSGIVKGDTGALAFKNPVVVSEGKKKHTATGLDLTGEVFIKSNSSNVVTY